MPNVHLSDETIARLRRFAATDNAEVSVRKLLDKVGATNATVNHGPALPRVEYHRPILSILRDHGGKAPVGQVLRDAEVRMSKDFSDKDWETRDSGGPRWQKQINFAGLDLSNRGFLVKTKGVWEITDAGRKYL